MNGLVVALAQSSTAGTLAHRGQDDVNNRLFAAANRHLHRDAVGQRQASTDQHVVTSPKHTWEGREREPIKSHLSIKKVLYTKSGIH